MKSTWKYGIVKSTALNVRKQPGLSAERWNNVWPLHRIALVKQASDGWYETLYRGELAFVSAAYIELVSPAQMPFFRQVRNSSLPAGFETQFEAS